MASLFSLKYSSRFFEAVAESVGFSLGLFSPCTFIAASPGSCALRLSFNVFVFSKKQYP